MFFSCGFMQMLQQITADNNKEEYLTSHVFLNNKTE